MRRTIFRIVFCLFILICFYHTRASTVWKELTTRKGKSTIINDHPVKSCLDVLRNGITESGFYPMRTEDGKTQTLFCDLCSEYGSAWTLAMSFSKKNSAMEQFLTTPLLSNAPLNDAIPNWNSYRLSQNDMFKISNESTHWRFTCSYPLHKVDYRDYARARLDVMNPLSDIATGACTRMEFLDIRGNSCVNCTAAWWQDTNRPESLHLDSSLDICEFDARKESVKSENNFGYYVTVNPQFRCSADHSATTNFWLGSYL